MQVFSFYQVSATYKSEHQAHGVIGCGTLCSTKQQAKEEKIKYKSDPKIASVKITHKRYEYR
jgi:hypothetical protein